MKTQLFGKPEVNLSWLLNEDDYSRENCKVTLDTEKGRKQLADTILMLIEQGMEIRIGSDGECLILEANNVDYSDASYQFLDEEHYDLLTPIPEEGE